MNGLFDIAFVSIVGIFVWMSIKYLWVNVHAFAAIFFTLLIFISVYDQVTK